MMHAMCAAVCVCFRRWGLRKQVEQGRERGGGKRLEESKEDKWYLYGGHSSDGNVQRRIAKSNAGEGTNFGSMQS